MTDETMIERVARALCRKALIENGFFPDVLDASVDRHWPSWQEEAVAAIAAMREPTEGMADAARGPSGYVEMDAPDAWRAMIDAALSPGKG